MIQFHDITSQYASLIEKLIGKILPGLRYTASSFCYTMNLLKRSEVGMRFKVFPGLVLSFSIVACAPDTLQSTFEKEQKDNQMDGFNIIHIEENEQYGLVLATSWTEQYIQNKDRPGINVYENQSGKWVARPGTSCDSPGASRLGIQNGLYLYCGAITEERPYVKITVGETEAKIFDVNDKNRVWYAVEESMDLKIIGSYASGEQVTFR